MNIKTFTEAEIQIEREQAARLRAAWMQMVADERAAASSKNKRLSWAQQLRADLMHAGFLSA